MKRFSEFMESCTTADINQGNDLGLGVTNHLTPVQNIVTNVRNLFPNTYIVASVGEDGVSVKLNSSRFISKEETQKYLYEPVWQNNSMASYIQSQGLDSIKMINLGMYFVVYFYPSDIKFVTPGAEPKKQEIKIKTPAVKEQYIEEAELESFINESDDDEELKDLTKQKLSEIIAMKDKVKAAKQFELLVSSEVELPREYYFAGVKDKQGNESIALRWKYTIKRPKGMTSEVTRSLINIYGIDKDGVWVGDFDEESLFQLPDEVKKLIETILDFIGASKTDDPCVYSLEEKNEESSNNKDDEEKKEEENKDTGKESSSNNSEKKEDNEDVEDDKSRSEADDLI